MLIFVRCELIENRLLTINLGCDEKCILFSKAWESTSESCCGLISHGKIYG